MTMTPEENISLARECADEAQRADKTWHVQSALIAIERMEERVRAEHYVSRTVYEAAVKGRQEFRASYRALLPVLRAAQILSDKWRANDLRIDDGEFLDAINAVDVAVTGGGAKPVPLIHEPGSVANSNQGDLT